jgi:hypothetical protein
MLKVGDIFQVPTPPDTLVVVGLVTKDEDKSGYVEGYQMTLGLHKGTFYSVSHGAYKASKIILLVPAVEAPAPPAADEDDAEEAALADARAATEG